MPAQPDLHRSAWVHFALIRQVSPPMRGRFLRAQEMIHLSEYIRMRIQMQKADRLTARQLTAAKRLHNAPSDRMIAAN